MLAFVLLSASLVLAAPMASRDSITAYNSSITQTLSSGSLNCSIAFNASSIVVTLPANRFKPKFCGNWIALTNVANQQSVLAQIVGSARKNYTLGATKGTWNRLGGNETNMTIASWRFASDAESKLVMDNIMNALVVAEVAAVDVMAPPTASESSPAPIAAPVYVSPSLTPEAYYPDSDPAPVYIQAPSPVYSAPNVETEPAYSYVAPYEAPTSTAVAFIAAPAYTPPPVATPAIPLRQTQDLLSGIATFFTQDGGAGSCGDYNSDSTYIVAVQAGMMSSSLCGKQVQITRTSTGSSIIATIADTCPGCNSIGSLDLSIGAFNALGDPSEGIFNISWFFI